jgi:hypothetical protein
MLYANWCAAGGFAPAGKYDRYAKQRTNHTLDMSCLRGKIRHARGWHLYRMQ